MLELFTNSILNAMPNNAIKIIRLNAIHKSIKINLSYPVCWLSIFGIKVYNSQGLDFSGDQNMLKGYELEFSSYSSKSDKILNQLFRLNSMEMNKISGSQYTTYLEFPKNNINCCYATPLVSDSVLIQLKKTIRETLFEGLQFDLYFITRPGGYGPNLRGISKQNENLLNK